VLYFSVPTIGRLGSIPAFVIAFGIILSMYGGGFATIRPICATSSAPCTWAPSMAAADGVVGCRGARPLLVNYIRQSQIEHGVPKAQAYSVTMYIMCALLFIGFLCNLLMHPVDSRHHFKSDAAAAGARRSAS